MDVQTRKLNLIAYLTQLQDENILSKIEKFILNKEVSGKSKSFEPLTIEELLSRIEKSEKDFKNGNCKTQEELEKISSNW